MTSTTLGTFTIERTVNASPEKVFKTFSDSNEKNKWFGPPPGAEGIERSLDFKVGGTEHLKGETFSFDATYQDIVPNERIIYSYYMFINGKKISVSLATILFVAEGEGTKLTITEQGAFLDGLDTRETREHGTNELLDKLVALFA